MKALTSVVNSVGKSKILFSFLMFTNNFFLTPTCTFLFNYCFSFLGFFPGNTVTKNFLHGSNESKVFFTKILLQISLLK